jgi:glyoxalase-like protein
MDSSLDHIIWVCDDLARASQRFEALSGVRPTYGGTHAGGLTHNALVAIGERCYLEILAPAGPSTAKDDDWCRLARAAHEPRILTYCLHSSRPLSELAAIAATLGWDGTGVARNGRVTPEGVRLSWQWLAPTVERFGLAFPFFIDWLNSPHPAKSLEATGPAGEVRLLSFAVGHPDAVELRQTLAKFGFLIEVYGADRIEFRVRLQTANGEITL